MINTQAISSGALATRLQPLNEEKGQLPFEVETPPSHSTQNWHQKTLECLTSYEKVLDEKMPNGPLQNRLDNLGIEIEKAFNCFPEFNKWLDANDQGQWYQQLALFLIKLPPRSARNVINILCNLIKSLLYAAVHPLKAAVHAAKHLVLLFEELSKPKNWSKIGASVVSASVGQFFGTGCTNPLSTIGIGVGLAIMISGVTIDSIKTAYEAEKGGKLKAVGTSLYNQAKQIPEAALTGFFIGLFIGSVHQKNSLHSQQTNPPPIINQPIHFPPIHRPIHILPITNQPIHFPPIHRPIHILPITNQPIHFPPISQPTHISPITNQPIPYNNLYLSN